MKTLDRRADASLPIPRPAEAGPPVERVREILDRVRRGGDEVLLDLTEELDGVRLERARVPPDEIQAAFSGSDPQLIAALEEMASRLRRVAERQALGSWDLEVGGGLLGETVHPVGRAGIYVPGGRAAYPSTVIMAATPAKVAGVEEIAMCVPPSSDGSVASPTLAAAHLAGITEVYRLGGAQAIGALAFGSESIEKVDVVCGPGNIYVALAKQEVAGVVAIDSVAGPSEIAIVADGSAPVQLLLWDLIAQAEHGPGGAFLVVTWEEELALEVESLLPKLLEEIGASEELRETLEEGAAMVLVNDPEAARRVIEGFAPEHLELLFAGAEEAAPQFRNAGAIFVGEFSPVSLGDYLAGSNHILPTAGAARWALGLRTSHFQRTTVVVRHTSESLRGALDHLEILCEAEGLPLHARAAKARFLHDRETSDGR